MIRNIQRRSQAGRETTAIVVGGDLVDFGGGNTNFNCAFEFGDNSAKNLRVVLTGKSLVSF